MDSRLARRQALILRVWEAVNAERHLQGVLEAVTNAIVSTVPYESIGIVHFDGAKHDLYAIHIVGVPHREGETLKEFIARHDWKPRMEGPSRPYIPYDEALKASIRPGSIYVCDDVWQREAWYEHEFSMAASGVRAYCTVPLFLRDNLIGAASFARSRPDPFSAEQQSLLMDIARALAVAVANALANEEIRTLRDRLEAENISLRAQLGQAPWFEDIVGDSEALRRTLDAIDQVAATDATVLISGETGTGKELIARGLHRRSPRAHGPLVKVNCAAIPEALLASELFGHERGAFTGAAERRKGRFEQAHGGTLFLDEVGEMPPETQVMLLRVLQEREFERLGGSQTVQVDVRIVAATNRNLAEEVREGRFRSDLYYRLSVFPVQVPPLRSRPEDIPGLVTHFANKYATRFARTITQIDGKTLQLLQAHDWPGNVRELENTIERAVILSANGILRIDAETLPAAQAQQISMPKELREQERDAIEAALRCSRGRISGPNGAARQLSMPASTLEFRIRRLGIDKHRFRG